MNIESQPFFASKPSLKFIVIGSVTFGRFQLLLDHQAWPALRPSDNIVLQDKLEELLPGTTTGHCSVDIH